MQPIFNKRIIINLLLFITISSANAQFIHPGITHKESDLDRMKYMVEAEKDPWYTSYQDMVNDSKSSYDYNVQGDLSFTELGRDSGVNYGAWNSDIRASYYNAIRWYVTGDARHAEKAIEIFNSWVNLEAVTSNGTTALSGGVAYIMIEAAEIIKHTYNGWSDVDIKKFEDMLVYPGYSNTSAPSNISKSEGTFYWQSYLGDPIRHGNQGLSGWRTIMAMGIFLDNEIIYDRALRYIKGLPHRSDDLPYPSGPNTSESITSSDEFVDTYSIKTGSGQDDYGFNELMTNYIWENGQCQESSRDQQHTMFGIGLLTSMAEMAWNQGENLYEFADERLLLGLEYNMRYNVSAIQSYPDQIAPWNPTVVSGEFVSRFDRTGRWFSKAINPDGIGDFSGIRNVFEMPVAHYLGRGFKTEEEVKWITRARDKAIELSGFEKAGWTNDALGWGGLVSRRAEGCFGDPISGFDLDDLPIYSVHNISDIIEAENFDYDPLNNGEGRVYHDLSSSNTAGKYRNMDNVDIEGTKETRYNLTSIESGEWLTYTVFVPERAIYSVNMNYAASQSGGTIKFSVAGEDKTSDLSVPFGAPNSTSNSDWTDFVISDNIVLNEGVQSLKLFFSGTSESFKLNHFKLTKTGVVKKDQTIQFFTIPNKVLGGEDFDPSAISSGDLGIEYSSSNNSVATIVDGKVHIVGVGKTTITASQNGNDLYNAASSVGQELTVVAEVAGTVNLATVADTYVHEGSASNNFGETTSMVTKLDARYALVKFDLHSVPGTVISAKLRLYQRTRFRDLRTVYDVENDHWNETDVTFNNKPAYNNERSVITTTPSTWCEWDVSSYVAQEYLNDQIITFAVKDPANSGVGIDFYAKENLENVPELVIEYSDIALSVKNQSISIKTYPNPVVDMLTISDNKDADVQVFNVVGELVYESKIQSNEEIIDMSGLVRGMYFIRVSKNGVVANKKIIKK